MNAKKYMNIVAFGVCFFIGLWGFEVRADFVLKDWKLHKDISVSVGGLQKLTLDKESFAGMQIDLSDIRIIDAQGEEAPYQMIVEKSELERKQYSPRMFNNAYTPNEYQQFMLDLGKAGMLHNSLSIRTSERNFQRTVEIAGSHDASSWEILLERGYIYDYTDTRGSFHAQDTSLAYGETTFRYLRVKVFSSQSFQVSGATMYQDVDKEEKNTLFEAGVSQNLDTEGNTVVVLDLGQAGLPTQEITVMTDEKNFDRPALLYEVLENGQERNLTSGYFFRYDTPNFRGENLTVRYNEVAARKLKLVILNGDDKPLRLTGALVKGTLRSIYFEAQSQKSYRLYYGNENARRPVYDFSKRLEYLDTEKASIARLGAQKDNPAYEVELAPLTERYSFFMPLIFVLAALVMLFIVYRFLYNVRH